MPHSIAIAGLHSCKVGNEPVEGEVKTFIIEQRTSAKGKPWTKIKSAGADFGGTPYRIISAEKTDFVDSHGNLSFNLQIEAENGSQSSGNAPRTYEKGQGATGGSRDDYWQRKEQIDADKQPRIERQHAQEMSLMYFSLTKKVPTTDQLRDMTSWFQRDVANKPEPEKVEVQADEAPF